jgi:hypothetical protein
MNAPATFDHDRKDASRYAPPWARGHEALEAAEAAAERVARSAPAPRFQAGPGESPSEWPRPVDFDAGPNANAAVLRNHALRRSLEPRQMPPPPIDMREQRRARLFRRLGVPVIFSALAAFVIVMLLGGLDQKITIEEVSKAGAKLWSRVLDVVAQQRPVAVAVAERPLLRLPAQNRSNVVNRPIPLGIGVTAPAPGASVLLVGLAAGTMLTVGTPSGEKGWRIAASDIDGAYVVPPLDFAGDMDLAVDLRLANDAIADRNVVRLSWTQAASNVEGKADKEQVKSAHAAATAQPAEAAAKSVAVATPVDRDLAHEEIAALLKRGKDLIGRSDISAARLVLRRAAEGGSARAAFALAASYDPAFLEKINVVGATPDVEKARTWYAKAAKLGSGEAPQHIERLAQQAR